MAGKKGVGSAKRFGARYGPTLKQKVGRLEAQYRNKQECPYCKKIAVKRLALGIWNCRKCDSVFTGRAYTVQNTIIKKKIQQEEIELPEESQEKKVETTVEAEE